MRFKFIMTAAANSLLDLLYLVDIILLEYPPPLARMVLLTNSPYNVNFISSAFAALTRMIRIL